MLIFQLKLPLAVRHTTGAHRLTASLKKASSHYPYSGVVSKSDCQNDSMRFHARSLSLEDQTCLVDNSKGDCFLIATTANSHI